MKVTFHLANYTANHAEQIYLLGSTAELGTREFPVPLTYTKNSQKATIIFQKYESATYRYFTDIRDDVMTRALPPFVDGAEIVLSDDFSPSRANPWYSTAFQVIAGKPQNPSEFTCSNHVIRVLVPYPCASVSISTSQNWSKSTEMHHIGNRIYEFLAPNDEFEYKFITNQMWEFGENHKNFPSKIGSISTHFFRYENAPKTRFSGVNTPVFSLKTTNSVGCGEFSDLKMLSDLCSKTGVRVIQILPINDTQCENNWKDSYPYSGISVFAMHPIYANLREIEGASEFEKEIQGAKMRCAGGEISMDYELTISEKMRILRLIYNKQIGKLEGKIKKWVAETRDVDYWIYGYCVFKWLTEQFGTIDFSKWGKNAVYDNEKFVKLDMQERQVYLKDIFYGTKKSEIWFYAFIQYVLDQQLVSAASYARENGVFLKGDIPIGVNPISVDTWERTGLFNMDTCTGAPPDQFSETGQNWGFPTYNWTEMQKDNQFEWWSIRFRSMERYFDSFRIDHVLGWFRIWEIPGECVKGNGRLGHFAPCDPIYWDRIQFWDIDRLCEPLLEKSNVIPTLCNVSEYEFLENNGFFYFDSIQNRLRFSLNEKQSVDKARKLITDDAQFENIKTAIVLLNANRCMTRDRLNGQNCGHPIFCNLKYATETPSFKALNDGTKHLLREIANDYFFKAHQGVWADTASIRLPIIGKASNMLIIGEDLGLLAPIVPQKMEEFGLLGLRVHNMPSNPQNTFQTQENYSWMTVCTPGTHDCPSLRSWWSRGGKQVEEYWRTELDRHDDCWKKPLTVSDSLNIVRKLLHTESMISMFLIQDWTAITEKTRYSGDVAKEDINHPEIAEWYWRYRMPMTIEDLLENKEFCSLVREEIQKSGRII
ncbi:4-alpha-glucanotransferase [Spironucleus salmonicida]|uniref:4-alpha-glucanotransferase n=1 Tax=Spironucleus salmonicida TaxID=348837 RepID=V6LTJ6_9EUKA|nr:4-alpha-glucanotransferase [Spironucleus salmonicida]|eukprot:EST47905.1 4-alpha-glucanotransferase [Spironucleus salmonicida]